MSDWTWECEPDAENVVGGDPPLPAHVRDEVERIGQELADAVAVARIGQPFDPESSGVSRVFNIARGQLIVWYLEDARDNVVLIVQVSFSG
ncbi:hypothetical protein ABZ746_18550 [Streptomyces sp. NPDC020096]